MVKYLDNNSGFNMWNANRAVNTNAKPKSRIGTFLWWGILFIGTWWLFSMWNAPKNVPVPTDTENAIIATDVSNVPAHEVSSDKITANIQGLRVSTVALTDFAADATADSDHVTLLGNDGDYIEVGMIATGTTAPDAKTVWQQNEDKMRWRNSDGVIFTRSVTADGYLITVTDTIENKTKHDVSFAPYARIVRSEKTNSAGVATGAITNSNSKIKYVDWNKLTKKSYAYTTTNGFIGFADQYWETIANIASPDQTMRAKSIANKYMTDTSAAAVRVAPNDTGVFTTTIFAGPRDQTILDEAATTIGGIDDTIDYGWFWFLARPMLWVLNALNSLVMNYGIAIILMTILLRLLMWPLTRKSYTSSIAMQRMQPELQRIQKLYGNDKARLQMEMMNLYRTHKTSPMSGCLPMLIQIPIFFALYKALLVSVQMRNAHFLWIHDLAAMDPYFILPILMGATMWLQQYLQSGNQKKDAPKNDAAAATARMMKWLPVIFAVMFAWMPAGLVLYWTISNVFGIFQTYIIKKQLNNK
ncbi:MAG: membrane protein insertase YidC [Alphaproteobacteria bacterium]|nr:membrane protein insertase YidC [Alphaproteobacteria bacterium]